MFLLYECYPQFLVWVAGLVLGRQQAQEQEAIVLTLSELKECVDRCLVQLEDCKILYASMGPAVYYTYGLLTCDSSVFKCADVCTLRAQEKAVERGTILKVL